MSQKQRKHDTEYKIRAVKRFEELATVKAAAELEISVNSDAAKAIFSWVSFVPLLNKAYNDPNKYSSLYQFSTQIQYNDNLGNARVDASASFYYSLLLP